VPARELPLSKTPSRLPLILSPREVVGLLRALGCAAADRRAAVRIPRTHHVRLRVKDLNLERREIVVRDGKEANDRITMVADRLVQPLRRHLLRVRQLHEMDVHEGLGSVFLLAALDRKSRRRHANGHVSESWRSRCGQSARPARAEVLGSELIGKSIAFDPRALNPS
jgi:integrase